MKIIDICHEFSQCFIVLCCKHTNMDKYNVEMTHLSLAEVQMHPVVSDRDELQVKVLHAVNLELEREGRL